MSLEIRQGQYPFRDDVNFPHGLSRSGCFSISQSELLKVYGETLKQLELGTLSPVNDAEENFVAFTRGQKSPETQLEKLWDKYLSEIKRSRTFHTIQGNSRASDNDARSAGYGYEDADVVAW